VYSAEFIDSSSVLWRKYNPDVELNQDAVTEMVDNLSGYFDLLKKWSDKDDSGAKKD